ncbi:hypothetical protein CR513_00395, partial [Mucuna pruriens]
MGSMVKAKKIKFTMVNASTSYNAIVSTVHLRMKYPVSQSVRVIRIDQRVARKCYDESTRVANGGYTLEPRRGFEGNLGGFRAPSEDKNWSIPRAIDRGDSNTDT